MTVLTMPCWFYDKKDLRRSPSIVDGIDMERESRYRREGARFIINVGTKMGLRYDTMATGVVYFHRFYMFHSFKTFPRYIVACCCLFLAGKVEETPKKCKDVIRIAKTFLNDAQFAQFGDDPKEEVMTLERILLQTIKFDLQVDHPYGYLLRYAKCLKGDQTKLQNMVQMAWTFINDSLCTTLCLQWEPEVIAIALMYLAGKLSKFEVVDWNGRTSKHSSWWDMYVEGMSKELLEDICHQVLDLYSTPVSETAQDSPPATPPTKSTIKKVLPPQNTTSPTAAPLSPVPAVKSKEVPVGQPIPRLEPGELKRKTGKASLRKESAEGKSSRPATSTPKVKKRRVSSGSPKSLSMEANVSAADIESSTATISSSASSSNSSSTQLKASTESAYHTGMASYTVAPNSDSLKVTMAQASSSTQSQYMPTYTRPMTFLTPEAGATFFPGGQSSNSLQQTFVNNTTVFPSQTQSALPSNNVSSQQVPAVQPPPMPRPTAASFPEVYSSQPPQPAPTQFPPPPPQMHNATTVNQYPAPPPPSQPPPTNMVLPNVSMPPPPPNPPSHLNQPPPPLPIPPNMAPPPRAPLPPGMPPNSTPVPPVLPPPSQLPPPRHFPPRPDHENLMGREHPPAARPMPGPMPRPPRFFHEGPPPQDFGPMSHRYEQDRPPPHFRSHPDGDYERDHMHEEHYPDYREDYNCGPPSGYGREYENPVPPYRRFGHERGPPLPIPRNPPPLMETPTGIPPVRITGSYGSSYPMG